MNRAAAMLVLVACAHTSDDFLVVDGHRLQRDRYTADVQEVSALAMRSFSCPQMKLALKVTSYLPDRDDWARTIEVSGCDQTANLVRCEERQWVFDGSPCPPAAE